MTTKNDAELCYQWFGFDDLSNDQLYRLLKLRVDVFVVEQNCPYPELDDLDQTARHLLVTRGHDTIACIRILPPGEKYADAVAIGRVATAQNERGSGLGWKIMQWALQECHQLWPEQAIQLSAQAHLKNFYQRLGFVQISDVYDEDGIDHIDMLKGQA